MLEYTLACFSRLISKFTNNGIFSLSLKHYLSMLKGPKSLKRSYVTQERKQVLINSSLGKLRSLDATETGRVKNSDNSVNKSGHWRR